MVVIHLCNNHKMICWWAILYYTVGGLYYTILLVGYTILYCWWAIPLLRKLCPEMWNSFMLSIHSNNNIFIYRMALPIVQGYLIDETKPWCAQYARSEPNFSAQVRKKQAIR